MRGRASSLQTLWGMMETGLPVSKMAVRLRDQPSGVPSRTCTLRRMSRRGCPASVASASILVWKPRAMRIYADAGLGEQDGELCSTSQGHGARFHVCQNRPASYDSAIHYRNPLVGIRPADFIHVGVGPVQVIPKFLRGWGRRRYMRATHAVLPGFQASTSRNYTGMLPGRCANVKQGSIAAGRVESRGAGELGNKRARHRRISPDGSSGGQESRGDVKRAREAMRL